MFSAQPTTWRRLFEPVANPWFPPSVGSALIFPFRQTNPRQMLPVREGKKRVQLQRSLSGSGSAVSAIPEMTPRTFLTGNSTLL